MKKEETRLFIANTLPMFPYWYTMVVNHSRFANITAKELSTLSAQSRINAEFLSAVGLTEIDFTPLADAIKTIDTFLSTGSLQREKTVEMIEALQQIDNKMDEIVVSYKDAQKADDNGFGAPIWCFVHRYATNLMGLCILIDDAFDNSEKESILKFLESQKRQDPDSDPSREKKPIPA